MTDSRAALDPNRLPWLTSEERAKAPGGASPLVTWGVALLMLVAGGSYWLGRNADAPEPVTAAAPAARETVRLPEPRAESRPLAPPATPLAEAPKFELQRPTPAVVPAPPRIERPVAAPARKLVRKARPAQRKAVPARSAKRAKAKAPVRRPVRRAGWPSPAAAVGLGRLIHIGTYSSSARTDRAWQSALRRYPQTRGLPKVVVPYKATNSRYHYRLMLMTTAAAQSQWLCRKMRSDWRRCSILR